MSLPYWECIQKHYSCEICGATPAEMRGVRYWGEDNCRMCDKCFKQHEKSENERNNQRSE